MHTLHSRRLLKARSIAAVAAIASMLLAPVAHAVSSWNPTLLVNTESFQEIDAGDGTTDIELRFGGTVNKLYFHKALDQFQFTNDVRVGGNLTATGALAASGSIRTDVNLTINDDQTAADAVVTFGSDGTNETITFANTADRFEFSDDVFIFGHISGSTLRVSGPAAVHGELTASGAFRADGNIALNDDATAADAVLTFGNDGGNETITFSDTFNEFSISDDLRVTGGLSASGNVMLEGNLTGATITGFGLPAGGCTGSTKKLVWNVSTSKFECATDETGAGSNGSGGIINLEPEYPNSTYTASGSAVATGNVGTLAYNYDSTNKRNFYRWQTTKTANQVYWIATRIRVPNNFSSWDAVKPIELAYRASGAYVDVRMNDTAGSIVPLTGASYLRTNNHTWTTANITGPNLAGTFTPKSYFNLFIKLTASGSALTTDELADVGTLNLNFESTVP